MPKNNPENFELELDTRIKEIDREIAWLSADARITAAGKAELNALQGELVGYQKIADESEKRKDGTITGKDKRDANKIARKVERYKDRLRTIKKNFNIGELEVPPVKPIQAYDVAQLDNVKVGPNGISVIDTDKSGLSNKTIRSSTPAEKQAAIAKIDAGSGEAADYATVGMGYLDHVIEKNTHATPGQAKTMRYLAAGAGAWALGSWVLKDGFSAQTFAKLGAIYAGTTMATGMNPIEFASAMFNGGHYPLLGIDPVAGDKEGKESVIAEQYNSSQVSDYIINSMNPDDLTNYITADNGQVKLDVRKILDDVSIDGQPIGDIQNLRCDLDNDKINKIFRPYHGRTGGEVFAVLLALEQKGETDQLSDSLTSHFTNIEADSSLWTGLLSNPTELILRSNQFTKALTVNAKAEYNLLKSDPQYVDVLSGYSLTPGFEIALLDEMLKMEREIDPNKVINPSTYQLPNASSFDYILLKQRLIKNGVIKIKTLENNIDARATSIKDIKSLLNANPGLIESSQQMKFAESFVAVKAQHDPNGSYGLEIRVINDALWIQGAGIKFACSGSSESTFNIDFSKSGTNITGTANTGLSKFEDKIEFAMAACILAGRTAGNILPREDKDDTKSYHDRPFKPTSKSIEVVDGQGWFKQSLFGGVDFQIVDQIMGKLESKTGSHGPARNALCALLNGMKYNSGAHKGESIWMVNKGSLPPQLTAVNESGTQNIESGYGGVTKVVINNPTFLAKYQSLLQNFSKATSSTYNIIFKDGVKKLYGDGVDVVDTLYTDAAKGTSIVLVDLRKQGGGLETMQATVTKGLVEFIKIVRNLSEETHNRLISPLYAKLKNEGPQLLKDLEGGVGHIYDGIKRGAGTVDEDARARLKDDGAQWYNDILKAGAIAVGSDVSVGLDKIGKDIGAKMGAVAERTIGSLFQLLGLTGEQLEEFNTQHPEMSGAIAALGIGMTPASNVTAILGGMAVSILGWAKGN